jgi:hypothetical protein
MRLPPAAGFAVFRVLSRLPFLPLAGPAIAAIFVFADILILK